MAAARLNMDPAKALCMPLALLGHLVASIARADGKIVGRKFSPKTAKEILAWGAKSYGQL